MATSRISGIIPLLFITLLCVGAVEGGYQLFERLVLASRHERHSEATQAPANKTDIGVAVVKKKANADLILQRNLFGALSHGEKAAAPVVAQKTEVPVASGLEVVLMGTITGSEGTERAIIYDKKNSKQELYGRGEAVKGALVREIRRGKVILAQNGRDEILDISEAAKVRPRVPAAVPAPQMAAPQVPASAPVVQPVAQPVPAAKNAPVPEKVGTPPEEASQPAEAAEPPAEASDTNATQIRLSRVSPVARGQEPGPNNQTSNATQQQGNTNE